MDRGFEPMQVKFKNMKIDLNATFTKGEHFLDWSPDLRHQGGRKGMSPHSPIQSHPQSENICCVDEILTVAQQFSTKMRSYYIS